MKNGREELAFLPGDARDALSEITGGGEAGPVFRGAAGARLSARHARRRLACWLAVAGVARPTSPHSLRHTFATGLLRRTGDLALVQAALHHRSIASTIIYARADVARVRAAVTA